MTGTTRLSMVAMALLVGAGAILGAPGVAADEHEPDPMAFFERWLGRWEGDGWMRRGPEEQRFSSVELIEERLKGDAVLVEGLHHDADGNVVHNAIALVTYDAAAGDYDFRTFVSGQGSSNAKARIEGDQLIWGFDTPRGTIRFTIELTGDAWHEIGEFSADGDTWTQFFQMDLRRVGDLPPR